MKPWSSRAGIRARDRLRSIQWHLRPVKRVLHRPLEFIPNRVHALPRHRLTASVDVDVAELDIRARHRLADRCHLLGTKYADGFVRRFEELDRLSIAWVDHPAGGVGLVQARGIVAVDRDPAAERKRAARTAGRAARIAAVPRQSSRQVRPLRRSCREACIAR
jgi:hypothetical protein